MNGSTRDRFRALVPSITPPAVARFMAERGWELEKRREGVREIWRYPSIDSPECRYRVMLPLAEDYQDHEERLGETLIALGRIYDLDPWGLLEKIRTPGVDFISIKLNKIEAEPTVTLIQVKSMVDGFYDLLQSAAVRARNPNSAGGGRPAKQVIRYMSDNVRFSRFSSETLSLTVMSRLYAGRVDSVSNEEEVPYPRQVMRTLMRDLASMRVMAGHLRNGLPVLSGFRGPTVGAASAKNLASMIDSLDLRSIDFSFQFAAGYEDVDASDVTLTFQRGELEYVRDLKQALSPRTVRRAPQLGEVSQRSLEDAAAQESGELTLRGPVQGIFRNSDDVSNSLAGGVMMMSADLGKAKSTVYVQVDEYEYAYAIEAHRRNIDVTVRGRVTYSGSRFELHGNSALDIEELKRSIK